MEYVDGGARVALGDGGILLSQDGRIDGGCGLLVLLVDMLGLGLVVAVKTLLKAPLHAVLPAGPADAVRYFLLVMLAGCVWPMTFRYFSRLGKQAA